MITDVVRAILKRPRELFFDQREITQVDLCAASVLNALVRDASQVYGVRCRGFLPRDPEANEIVRATGLPRILRALPAEGNPKDFMHFELTEGRKIPVIGQPADKHFLTTKVTHYVNDCLKRFGSQLTEEGREFLSSLAVEVIDNAERHSGQTQWWIAGYLRQRPGAPVGDCHLVIFNFGKSFAESLQTLPDDAVLRQGAERLVEVHRSSFRASWTEADLWSLYALQQGVSAQNTQVAGEPLGHNGQGTCEMINLFQLLGQRRDGNGSPLMALVTGSTYFRFDGRYPMETVADAGGIKRKMITFNDARSLNVPPDPERVWGLRRPFPGSIISLRFFLDKHYLEALHRGS